MIDQKTRRVKTLFSLKKKPTSILQSFKCSRKNFYEIHWRNRMNVCKRKIHNMDLRLMIQAVHPKADTGGNLLKEKKKKDLDLVVTCKFF